MNDAKNLQKNLSDQTAKEQSFRRQIVAGIVQLLKDPSADPFLKFFTVLGLLVIVGISFVFSVFLIDISYSAICREKCEPLHYAYIILALLALLIMVAVPFVFKASKTEQALRLDYSFNKIYEARFGR